MVGLTTTTYDYGSFCHRTSRLKMSVFFLLEVSLTAGLCLQMGLLSNLEAVLSESFVMKLTVGASFGDVIFFVSPCVWSHITIALIQSHT